jgi:hypothetical protein
MTAFSNGDRRAIYSLKQEFASAVERVHALGWAIARLEGKDGEDRIAHGIEQSVLELLSELSLSHRDNVVSFKPSEVRPPEPISSTTPPTPKIQTDSQGAQNILLDFLKGREASIAELQNALDDHQLGISPGNLSVILSRMTQAGQIVRTGRGIYRAE